MDTLGLIITCIGTIIGIIGLYYAVRRRKNPGIIASVGINSIDLFNTIVKNFQQIKILFEEISINENIVFWKSAIVNLGDIDITNEMIKEPLYIVLPENFYWINVQITSHSPDLECTVEIEANKLFLSMDIFRRDEFFIIESLVQTSGEGSPTKLLAKSITFHHRIANTRSVHRMYLDPKLRYTPFQKAWKGYLLFFSCAMAFCIGISFINSDYRSTEFGYTTRSGKFLDLKVEGRKNDSVILTNSANDFSHKISIAELNDSVYRPKYRVVPSESSGVNRVRVLSYIALGLILILCFGRFVDYTSKKEAIKIRKILQNQ
jgi:hypothetical protein